MDVEPLKFINLNSNQEKSLFLSCRVVGIIVFVHLRATFCVVLQ